VSIRPVFAWALAPVLLLSAPVAAAVDRPLEPRDIFNLEAVASPQISPDGSAIAYIRRTNDIETDQTLGAIWLIDADGSDHRPLISRDGISTAQPVWSPDGSALAFIRTEDSASAIWIYDTASGDLREVTPISGGAGNLQWSPDARYMAYAGFIPEEGPHPAPIPEYEDATDWAAPAQVEDRLVYRIDGVGPLPRGSQHLFLIDVADGSRDQITEGTTGAGGDFVWSVDGKSFLVSTDRRPDAGTLAPDSEIYRVDVASGEFTALTNRRGPDNSPRPSPDGSLIAYLGYDDQRMGYHNTGVYLMNADGSEPRRLSGGFDRSIGSLVWAADGSGLYVQYEDQGDTVIAFLDLDGQVTPIVGGLGSPTFGRPYTGGSYSVAETGRLAFTTTSPQRPAELAVGDAEAGFTILTQLNEDALGGVYLSDAEEIRWASPHDGLEIQGWVLYPPDFNPENDYPLILEIHGGPFSGYGPVFSAELQLMAAAGYVVVYTNPRGSTGYGYDFANEIHHAYPGNDYYDLMGAVDTMLARGFIDEDRLFITGGSGGGTLTAWSIGQTDRFAAAVVVKPVINWSSFVLHADLPQFFYRYWFGEAPWENPEAYWARSPLSLVGNVETPTLMMVGGADVRTPRSETEQYYSALRLRGVPSELVIIPDSYHGIANSRPSRLLTKVAEILRWFERHDDTVDEG